MPQYAAIYETLGVDAKLTLRDGRIIETLRVVDKTDGVETAAGDVGLTVLVPAATVRGSDLRELNILKEDLEGSILEMSGGRWSVQNYRIRPGMSISPDGEFYLYLRED